MRYQLYDIQMDIVESVLPVFTMNGEISFDKFPQYLSQIQLQQNDAP